MNLRNASRKLVAIVTCLLILATGTLSLASTAAMAAGDLAPETALSLKAGPLAAEPLETEPHTASQEMPCHQPMADMDKTSPVQHKGCPMGGERCHCITGTSVAPMSMSILATAPIHSTRLPQSFKADNTLPGIHTDLLRPPTA